MCIRDSGDIVEEHFTANEAVAETILLVDDDQMVLSSIKELLQAQGYTVFTADNGVTGLETFEQHADKIDLVITDSVMPQMNGEALIDSVQRRNANIKAILFSGCVSDSQTVLSNSENTTFLQKPVGSDTLHRSIRQLLDCD